MQNKIILWGLAVAAFLGVQTETFAQQVDIVRVSVSSNGQEGNLSSHNSSVSSDGRYTAFQSFASNLVNGDNNGVMDIFVHDRQMAQTTRVSVSSMGAEGNSYSQIPSISWDGRYVAFRSLASNLVMGDNNNVADIFVHDRQNGQTTRVSLSDNEQEGNGASEDPSISTDGRYVTFQSAANNLVIGDNNGWQDIFVRDRQLNETTLVSKSSNGELGNRASWEPKISDGRYVAFASYASNLVAGDNNNNLDVFVHDRQTGQTTRVSVSSNGDEGNSYSQGPSITTDGRYVTFESEASNLVAGDNNNTFDIFVHDRQLAQTTRISVSDIGEEGNGPSRAPDISSDGRYIAFHSPANNLISQDDNNAEDVFRYDRLESHMSRVSLTSQGGEGNGASRDASISLYGDHVSFYSWASNLVVGDNNATSDTFVVRP